MKYFIVFQNQTYEKELQGGYLWAPKIGNGGRTFAHWTNMTKVVKDDIIFSCCKRNIVSVNVAQNKCTDHMIPSELEEVQMWKKEGWMVPVKYHVLENPIAVDDHIDIIVENCKQKHSPFNVSGRGNQGYLFEVNQTLGTYLLAEAARKNWLIT